MVRPNELKVIYNIGGRVDSALDAALTEALKKQGWHWWASGCDHTNGERDLAFDRTLEEEGRIILPPPNRAEWLREHPGAEAKLAAFFEEERAGQ